MGISDVVDCGGLAWGSAVKQNNPFFYDYAGVQVIVEVLDF